MITFVDSQDIPKTILNWPLSYYGMIMLWTMSVVWQYSTVTFSEDRYNYFLEGAWWLGLL